jgi:hypothetical protein
MGKPSTYVVYLSHSKIGNPFQSEPSLPFIVARGEDRYKREIKSPSFNGDI